MTDSYAVALTGADQAAVARPTVYRGISIRETGGSASVQVQIFDNAATNSGTLIESINLGAGLSAHINLPIGLGALAGLYVKKSGSGTFEGSLRIG